MEYQKVVPKYVDLRPKEKLAALVYDREDLDLKVGDYVHHMPEEFGVELSKVWYFLPTHILEQWESAIRGELQDRDMARRKQLRDEVFHTALAAEVRDEDE